MCTVLLLIGIVYIGLEWEPVTDSVLEAYKAVADFSSLLDYQVDDNYEDSQETDNEVARESEGEESVQETQALERREIVSNESASSTPLHSFDPQVGQDNVNNNVSIAVMPGNGLTHKNMLATRSQPVEGRNEVTSIDNTMNTRHNRRVTSPCRPADDMCRLFSQTLLRGELGSPVGSPVGLPVSQSADTFNERMYSTQSNASSGGVEDASCDVECVAFRATLTTWPINKPKAFVYFFIQQPTLIIFRQAIRSFDRQFNRQFHYPVVVFISQEFDSQLNRKDIRGMISSAPIYIQTVRLSSASKLRHQPSQGRRRRKKQSTAESVEVCRFHAGLVYDTPIFRSPGLEYVLRLADDWLMAVKIKFDMFKHMKTQRLRYGFWREQKFVSDAGLYSAVEPYVNSSVALRTAYQSWHRNPPMYDVKWELSALSLWQSTEYRDYFAHVDRLGGILNGRCSESAIKSIGVALFTSQHEIHRFRDVYYVRSVTVVR